MRFLEVLLDKLPPLEDKNRNFILIGFMGAILLVFYFVAIGPQLGTLSKVNPQISLMSQDIIKAKEDSQKVSEYQGEIGKLENTITEINQRIRSREELPVVLEGISRLADEHNVHVNQLMPQVEAQEVLLTNSEGKFFGLPILLDVSSGYHDLGKFLNDMQKEGLGLTIERLTIANNADDIARHSVKMTLRTIVFEKSAEEKKN